MKKIVSPAAGYNKETGQCDNKAGLLWDDFKSHSCKEVKDFCQSLDFLGVDIIPGGLTPEAQPLDKVINKVFKGYFRDFYDEYVLNAPVTEKGNPKPPSRQLLATWVVKAWEKIPEQLVRNRWFIWTWLKQIRIWTRTPIWLTFPTNLPSTHLVDIPNYSDRPFPTAIIQNNNNPNSNDDNQATYETLLLLKREAA
mgnify:CR=1 FL=1